MQTGDETSRSESTGESSESIRSSSIGLRGTLTSRIVLIYAAVLVLLSIYVRCVPVHTSELIILAATEWAIWLSMALLVGMASIVLICGWPAERRGRSLFVAVNLALGGLVVLCQLFLFEQWFFRSLEFILRLATMATWGFAVFGLVPVVLRIAQRRQERIRQPFLVGRVWFATIMALVLSESLCSIVAWRQMIVTFPESLRPPPDGELHVVALGGSAMKGVPNEPKFSIPTIVAWRMRQMYPGKTIVLKNLADVGLNLREAIRRLEFLEAKPHLLLLYSGHNEFFHEIEELAVTAKSQSPELDRWLRNSPTFVLLDRLLSRRSALQKMRRGTTPFVANHLAPSALYADRLIRFRRQLEQLAQYCRRQEISTLWFVPASSESGFEPNRSVPSRPTTESSRRELRGIYDRARSLENDGKPTAAAELYRRGLDRQPGFAEFYFRLGHCLLKLGHNAEAAQQFQRASDTDGYPVRANRDYRDLVASVAQQFQVPLIDSPEVLRRHTAKGILDRSVFYDNVHFTLKANYLLGIAACEQWHDDERLTRRFGTPVDGDRPEFAQAVSAAGMTVADLVRAYARNANALRYMTRWRFDASRRIHDAEEFDRWSRQLKNREIKPGDDGTETLR